MHYAWFQQKCSLKAKVEAMRLKREEDNSFSITELSAFTQDAYPLTNIV